MKNIMKWILSVPAIVIMPVTYLGGIAIYIWTIVIAFNMYGWLAAGISLFTPILSTLFFIYKTWQVLGFWNTFILSILIYIALIIINTILISIIQKLERDDS